MEIEKPKLKKAEQKIRLMTTFGEEFLGIKNLSSDCIVKQLEENMAVREMPIEKRIKNGSLKDKAKDLNIQ